MFNAGSIFVDVGAHFSKKGFEMLDAEVAKARGIPPVEVQLGGHLARRGFIAFADSVRGSEEEAKRFAGVASTQFGVVGKAGEGMATSLSRSLGLMRDQMGFTARDYRALGTTAMESAREQERAYAAVAGSAVKAETAQAAAAKGTEASWKKGFNTIANLGKYGLIGGAVAGGVGLKWASDYQKDLNLLYTQAGLSRKEVRNLNDQLIRMGREVGVTPKQLAEGMYHVASSHVAAGNAASKQAERLHILKVAAMGAKSGNDDMVSVTNALTAAMNAFHLPAKNAAAIMGELDRIAGQGNMVMKDLTAAMTTGVLAAASGVGLKLKDVGAALDVMTRQGVPAQEGATRLRTVLSLIAHPTDKATKALAELGFQHDRLAIDFREHGLSYTLEDLHQHMSKIFGHKLDAKEQSDAIHRYQQQLIDAGVTGASLDKQVKVFTKSLQEQGSGAIKSSDLINHAFGGARMGTTMVTLMQNIDQVRQAEEKLGVGTKKNTDLFQEHWRETEKTFSQQASQFWSAIQGIGIRIGEYLMPAVEKMMTGLEHFGDWLGKHETAAKALAITIGGVLTLAITAFFVRLGMRLFTATKNVYEFGKMIGGLPAKLFKWGDGQAMVTKKQDAAVVATDKLTASVDALNAAMERQAAVAEAAAAEMQNLTLMEEEAATASGIILPKGTVVPKMTRTSGIVPQPGVARAESRALQQQAAAEASAISSTEATVIGGGGLGRGLRTAGGGLRRVAGRGMAGGMVYLLGSGISDVAGSAIGGKAGKDVGHIGNMVAAGAGIGMLLGPEGALAGGVIGGLAGAFTSFLGSHHAEDYGKHIAHQVEHGMGKIPVHLTAPDAKTIDTATHHAGGILSEADKIRQHIKDLQNILKDTSIAPSTRETFQHQIESLRHQLAGLGGQLQGQMDKIGEAAGHSFMKGLSGSAKYWTEPSLFKHIHERLDSLPVKARASAANTMIEMSAQLERQGRLPKGSTSKLITDIEDQFTGLAPKVKYSARDAMNEIDTEIKLNKAEGSADGMFHRLGKTFGDFPKLAKTTGDNAQHNFTTAIDFLKDKVSHSTGKAKEAAESNLHKLEQAAAHWSGLTKQRAGQNFVDLTVGVASVMDGLGTVVSTGLSDIGIDVNSNLKDLGGKAIHFTLTHPKKAAKDAGKIAGAGAALLSSIAGIATGGVPNPHGGSQDDHILIDPQGNPVAAMSGTEGIFNNPQMSVIDYALASTAARGEQPFQSKEDLWGSGMRHYAYGGLMERANKLDHMHLPYVWGGHHGDKGPITNPRPGLDCSSAVSYVLGIPPRVSGQFENFGKPGPGPVTIYANPTHTFMKIGTRYFGTSGFGHPAAGGGPAWFTVNPSKDYLSNFVVRHVNGNFGGMGHVRMPIIDGPQGPIWAVGQQGLIDDTHRANNFLHEEMRKLDNSAGQPLKDVPGSPGQARRWTEQAMRLAGVGGTAWETMLLNQEFHESTYSPTAQNTTPAGLAAGLPQGIMQVTKPTFAAYHLRGHNNPFNAVDNIAAAIKYIIASHGGGNKAAGLRWMINNAGHAYKFGGRLSHRAAGVARTTLARAASTPGGVAAVVARSASTHRPHVARPHLHRPTRITGVGNLKKYEANVPSLTPVDTLDTAISSTEGFYQQASRFFTQQDPSLTTGDIDTLLGLMGNSGALNHPGEAALLAMEIPALESAEATIAGQLMDPHGVSGAIVNVEHQAHHTLRGIHRLEHRITRLDRRAATERHRNQGKMMAIAEKLAQRQAANADARNSLADRQQSVQDSWDKRIEGARANAPVIDTGATVAAIRARYRTLIQNEPTTAGRNRLRDRENAEIRGVQAGARSQRHAHSRHVSSLVAQRHSAMAGFERQRRGLTRQSQRISREEAAQRRKYHKEGWADLWAIQTKKWRLEDRLKKAREREYKLTGSTAHIGRGGQLAALHKDQDTLTAALTATEQRDTQAQGAYVDNAMNQLDLVIERAQATADQSGKYVELLGPGAPAAPITDDQGQPVYKTDPTTGAISTDAAGHPIPVPYSTQSIPDAIAAPLIPLGLMGNRFRRMLAPAAGAGSTAGAAGGGTTDPGAGAAAALAELSNLSAASEDLFSQFGSNLVSATPSALRSALQGAGRPDAAGVQFFGAAGGGAGAVAGYQQPVGDHVEQHFHQENHYQTGPEDPHVHAQVSRIEFEGAFG